MLAELGLQWQGSGEESEAELKQQCQWDASGMPVECQWDASGMPMECQWGANGRVFGSSAKFFLLKFVFVPIWRFLPFFLSTPFFFIIHSRFIFFFTFPPSLLRNLHRHQPSYCYISTFVVKSIRLRTSRRSSSRRSLSVFPSQNRPCDHWL